MINPTVFLHELFRRLKSVLVWGFSVTLLVLFFFSFFTVYAGQAETLQALLNNFSKELRVAFGMEHIDLSTVTGYAAFLFLYIQLCLAVQAANYGFGMVSIEETELTADFLLTKPISRASIFASKLWVAVFSILLTDLIVSASLFGSITLFRGDYEYDPNIILLLLASLIPFQLFFFSVGLLVSLLVRRIRSVTPYAMGLAFGLYALGAFSGIFGDVKLEYITPFKHFDATYIVNHAAFNQPLLLISVAVILLSILFAFLLYLRRDIHAVS
jgi:ABC-2 type transport system permease protein